MTDPSVEELVAEWESGLYDQVSPHSLLHDFVTQLIASWRERGEALEEARRLVNEYWDADQDADAHGTVIALHNLVSPEHPVFAQSQPQPAPPAVPQTDP